ncbi:uncharacterized protein LOC131183262 [Hevea brasiliensis]|uniref:uncharacterized protein LOC131183262 n=1 Tax=Hevea brasiliensis TaxID=3981 RepID=UPI0025E4A71F|nr:uncharacterized protein LOC131183262 [Hevea brasiliensis]
MAKAQHHSWVTWIPRAHRLLSQVCAGIIVASPLCVKTTSDHAIDAFQLKALDIYSNPLLPNFDLTFVIECDADWSILLQHNAYFSGFVIKIFKLRRELIGLVKALKHWHSYPWGREFIVRTDHYTLKYTLEPSLKNSTTLD